MRNSRLFAGKRYFWSLLVILGISLLYGSCKKSFLENQKDKQPAIAMAAPAGITISIEEIERRLPQTMVYNLAANLKFYVGRAQWSYRDNYLLVRIPLNTGDQSFVYAVKPYDNTDTVYTYLVQFLSDPDSSGTGFSGRQMWINLQNWNLYGVQYSAGTPVAGYIPLQMINPGWESCALENGLFSLENGKLVLHDDEGTEGENIALKGLGCPTNVEGKVSFWQKVGRFFNNVVSGISDIINSIGNWLTGLPGGDGTVTGGDYGGGWSSGWPEGHYGSGGSGGTPGGGGHPPDQDAPPSHVPIWERAEDPILWATVGDDPQGPAIPVWAGGAAVSSTEQVIYTDNPTVNFVGNILGLSSGQKNWLMQHLDRAADIMNYLIVYVPDFTLQQKMEIAREHLEMMMNSPDYLSQIEDLTGNWWDQDQDGFMEARKIELQVYLQANPYGMIDCDELNNMPMNMLQEIGSYQVPQTILADINIRIWNNGPKYTTNNTFIQDINNGDGVVNLDYFPVHISQLPNDPATNQTMTPLELLDYFRKNISPAFTQGNSTEFSPYYDNDFQAGVLINDANKYNSADVNSVGSWIHIHINPDDGSVVESDYEKSTSNKYFIFTTLATPIDGTHPVCGNRSFGIKPSSQGGYEFYISGVDRAWNWYAALANDNFISNYFNQHIGFDAADALWEQVQSNMINFVQQNGGTASYFAQPHKAARVQWLPVKDFLNGNETLQELKNDLNCP